jgi:uncharacterized protein (DUF58 family)
MSLPYRQILSSIHAIAGRLRALATYDLFPEFSATVRRLLYNPLGVLLVAALTALLCGMFLHAQGFVLFGGVLAVIVLGIAWPWLSLRGMHGIISFERVRVCEGDRVEVRLTLCNRLPWSAWGLAVRDGFTPSTTPNAATPPVATIASAPRRRTARCHWSLVLPCRGVYPLVVPRLTTGFPFGLWENRRPLSVEVPLIVWPRTFPAGPVPLVSGDQQVEGNVSRNKVGSNGDVLGVRPYRRGNSPRRIHWGQSARHDRLIVCELQANARPVTQLVLDADRRVHAGDGADSSRERTIRIVASLAKAWLEAGAQVSAVWNGEVLPPASGQRQLHRLLDSLARLADSPGPSLAETLGNPACRGFTDGLQVIVTTDAALRRSHKRPACEPTSGPLVATANDQQRWIVLRTAAFSDCRSRSAGPPPDLACRPWLWIDSMECVPALLRGGWKEAQHGT